MSPRLLALLLLASGCHKNPDTGTPKDTADTGPDLSEFCVAQGLPVRAFDASATGQDFDQVAGDITLPTTEGDWTLSESWTGCDSYVFVDVSTAMSFTTLLLDSFPEDWLALSPPNVHWFFLPYTSDQEEIDATLAAVQPWVEEGLSELDGELADHWRSRIHYGTETVTSTDGWVGELVLGYTGPSSKVYGFAMDRSQVLREVGSLYDPRTSWATVEAKYLAYEPIYYNFEAERQARLDAQGATVIRAFDKVPASDPGWAGETVYADVDLPADVASYDTLELDLTFACSQHPELGNCPAWDYLSQVYLCDADDIDSCSTEIGRTITTYWRAGRWVMDASPYLALLQEGGTRRFRVYTQQYYLVTLDLRFSNQGKGATARDAQFLWSGGGFNKDYNANHPSMTFTPPAGTTRVELVATISGHGYGSDPNYCGEFCNHQHEFTVNGGAAYTREYPEAGSEWGCADQVAMGTVPNQSGTWIYGRGGWCPGLEVQPWVVDITGDVTVGQENTLSYRGLVNGKERTVESTDAWIDLTSWVVFSN